MTHPLEPSLRDLAATTENRMTLWTRFVHEHDVHSMAEIGVYRGAFAENLLSSCPAVDRYYMLDPWRHLEDWNKPANKPDDVFAEYYAEALRRTDEYADRRVVLRGTTTEVIDEIPDGSLDAVYVDGDHTLRGITVDLALVYPKVREGGFVIGDDFRRSIFQHRGFEPTLVFPYAVYFAEAMRAPVFALPHHQFLIHKVGRPDHRFVDLAGGYRRTTLLQQIRHRDRQRARRRPAITTASQGRKPHEAVTAAIRALRPSRAD